MDNKPDPDPEGTLLIVIFFAFSVVWFAVGLSWAVEKVTQ